ncbi:MAG: uroporphyrinogen-III synthase [Candidatus Acidiferrales bacterium]
MPIVSFGWQEGPLDNRNKPVMTGPLAGKRVIVTRAPEQASELIRALEALGAEVLLLPTVGFAPAEDPTELDAAFARLSEFDWILFTSQNAVRFFCSRWSESGRDRSALGSVRGRVAAVGAATARALESKGMRVEYVAQTQTGESLAAELRDSVRGRQILLPRSDRVDDRLPSALREAGATVHEVTAYRTLRPETLDPEILDGLRRAEIAAIVFASPSAFHNLAVFVPSAELAALSNQVQFAAIGSTTARALREAGVRVAIESNDSSSAGLADAIAKYYQRQASTVRQA